MIIIFDALLNENVDLITVMKFPREKCVHELVTRTNFGPHQILLMTIT